MRCVEGPHSMATSPVVSLSGFTMCFYRSDSFMAMEGCAGVWVNMGQSRGSMHQRGIWRQENHEEVSTGIHRHRGRDLRCLLAKEWGSGSGSTEYLWARECHWMSSNFLSHHQHHSYLGERERQGQIKSFAQSRSHSTHGDKAGFKFPVACFQHMAAPSEPGHLSIMKGLWSQVTDEEFNLKGLHNLPKVRPGLNAGCLEWAGDASRGRTLGLQGSGDLFSFQTKDSTYLG